MVRSVLFLCLSLPTLMLPLEARALSAGVIKARLGLGMESMIRLFASEPSGDIVAATTSDAGGNTFATGTTCGTFPGETSAGACDCFVVKYNTSGVQQWLTQFGTSADDACFGVAVDGAGNIYVAGTTRGAFSGQTSVGGFDAILVKFTSAGVQSWVRQFGTSGDDIANATLKDSSNRPYVAGFTTGSFSGFTNAGGRDAFLARYTATGTQSWMRQFGTAGDDEAIAMDIDASSRVFVTGYTTDAFSGFTNAGSYDAFTARYSATGAQSWLKQFGTAGMDIGLGIGVIASSGVSTTVGISSGAFSGFTNAGGDDVFLYRFALAGSFQWASQTGTSADDDAVSAVCDASGNVYLTGSTFGSYPGFTNSGGLDAVIAAFNTSGVKTWLEQLGTGGDEALLGIRLTGSFLYSGGYTTAAFPGFTDSSGDDIVLTKYNSSGVQQWLQQTGSN